MPQNITYHKSLRKNIAVFGGLFDNIKVSRYADDGETVLKTILVPVGYGSKQKWFRDINERIFKNADGDPINFLQKLVPRISYEMKGIGYSSARKLQTTQKHLAIDTDNLPNTKSSLQRIPYDINFTVSIIVKNHDDGFQIIEQILPYFTPELVVNVRDVPDLGISNNMTISMDSISMDDNYESDLGTDVRMIIWTLDFTAKTYIYSPISSSGVIEKVINQFYTSDEGFVESYLDDDGNPVANPEYVAEQLEVLPRQITLTGLSGTFSVGETVYVGTSYASRTKSGLAMDWSSPVLSLATTSKFAVGDSIVGNTSGATGTVSDVASDTIITLFN